MKEVVVFLVGLGVGVTAIGILGAKALRQITVAKTEVTGLLERVARATEKR